MKNFICLIPTLALALGLTACDTSKLPGNTTATAPAGAMPAEDAFDGPVVAVVNGNELKQSMMDAYKASWQARRPDTKLPNEDVLINELINSELVYQDALAKGMDKSADVIKDLAMQARTTLISKNIKEFIAANPVTDEERKALYDERVSAAPTKEYKASHILLETEDDAKAAIAELDKGADFAELAKERSTGPSSTQGGSLGWFPPDRMVAPFSNAVKDMENGKYTSTPVQTQFGWHVILLEDQRDTPPPAMEDLEDQLTVVVRNQKITKFFAELRAKATVETKKQ